MNKEERKEVFSQYPTNQMVGIESPYVDKTKEKQDRKNDFADKIDHISNNRCGLYDAYFINKEKVTAI